jgi:hypothetical protein
MEEVRRIVSTADFPDFGRAACEDDGEVVAWHLTDDPRKITEQIRKKANFVKSYGSQRSELGPGLYVSCVPEFWSNRSTKKWAFIRTVGSETKKKIVSSLLAEVTALASRGRLSKTEIGYAERLVLQAEKEDDLDPLVQLAGQPFGIKWWSPSWLAEFGIKVEPPKAVKVAVRGNFAELKTNYPSPETLRRLRKSGIDGAFTKFGMSTNAEMVVFSGRSMKVLGVETIRD